jgi:hypothetical protein
MRGVGFLLLLGLSSCVVARIDRVPGGGPSAGGPESTCQRACRAKVSSCDAHQCDRGCNLVFDRFAEHEGDHVLACIAASKSSCDDRTWAHCATRVGPYADGGPPAPPLPSDVEGPDEGD